MTRMNEKKQFSAHHENRLAFGKRRNENENAIVVLRKFFRWESTLCVITFASIFAQQNGC